MVNISNSLRATALLILCGACSGCALTQGVDNYIAYNDSCNDFVMGWRNNVWARQAWHDQKQHFAGHQEFRAFGAGFRDGYIGVASGGNGCPPPVPPRKYWSWHYQTPEGQCKVAAWFEGYSHGAQAAEEQGAGNFQDIQVSYAIEAQYSPEFEAGGTPYLDNGVQFLYGQPLQPNTAEPVPAQTPATELRDPQSRAGMPVQDHRFGAVPAAFSTMQQPLPGGGRADSPHWQPGHAVLELPQDGGRPFTGRPAIGGDIQGVHPATYLKSEPQMSMGPIRAGTSLQREPTISRLPQQDWAPGRVASFQ